MLDIKEAIYGKKVAYKPERWRPNITWEVDDAATNKMVERFAAPDGDVMYINLYDNIIIFYTFDEIKTKFESDKNVIDAIKSLKMGQSYSTDNNNVYLRIAK